MKEYQVIGSRAVVVNNVAYRAPALFKVDDDIDFSEQIKCGDVVEVTRPIEPEKVIIDPLGLSDEDKAYLEGLAAKSTEQTTKRKGK